MADVPHTTTRYWGVKWRSLKFIKDSLDSYGVETDAITSACDLFSGTGAVSWMFANFKRMKYLRSNDSQAYACIFTKSRTLKSSPHLLDYVREADELCKRGHKGWLTRYHTTIQNDQQLFSREKANAIDCLTQVVPKTDTSAMGSLLDTVLKQSNGMGTLQTAANIKYARRSPVSLAPVLPAGRVLGLKHVVTCQDATTIVLKRNFDIIYIDPPYTTNSNYERMYHLLNTVAIGDTPVTNGKYNIRSDVKNSRFALKAHCEDAFKDIIAICKGKCEIICISYATYGLVPVTVIKRLLKEAEFNNIRLFQHTTPKYKEKGVDVTEVLIIGRALRK